MDARVVLKINCCYINLQTSLIIQRNCGGDKNKTMRNVGELLPIRSTGGCKAAVINGRRIDEVFAFPFKSDGIKYTTDTYRCV